MSDSCVPHPLDEAEPVSSVTYVDTFDHMGDGHSSQRVTDDAGPLAGTDMATLFGVDGPLAAQLPDYELRPSQLDMAEAVKRALLAGEHALIEAPTGTGKSIAYLLPALLTGKTIVVATANKSLQSQLFSKDIPFLRRILDQDISAVLVKGRSNFICTHKWLQEESEQRRLGLYDREDEQVTYLHSWLDETDTGDIDDLPFVLSGELRPRVVSFPDDCLQRDCLHYADNCWVNFMRDKAAEAQVLITNHHLLLNALELGWAGERILPPASIYIVDEAHQLEATATAVFETSVTDYTVERLLNFNALQEYVDDDELDELRFHNTIAFQEISHLSRENTFRLEGDLDRLADLGRSLEKLAARLKLLNPYANDEDQTNHDAADEEPNEARRVLELTLEALGSTARKLLAVATSRHDADVVRYVARIFDRRHITLEVHAAPINPATLLDRHLFQPEDPEQNEVERTVICTSATLATNGEFNHFKQRCGVKQTGEEHVLSAVFDYPRQTMLYQPSLPAYDWRDADAYYRTAANEIARLLEVSRGRALCLFTSWHGLQQVGDLLREGRQATVWPFRAQGEMPRDALLTWFKETPHSVLLATRSFWEGVDIPGDDLSLVVLDKMPFPSPKDPLHAARMKALEDADQRSFGLYMLPLMTLALKQGFGRLIRRGSDVGVVAILDERLTSKGYGRQARQDLPPARFSRNFKDVYDFFQVALDSRANFALNVQAEPVTEDLAVHWRWQLLRLQDGKADTFEKIAQDVTAASAGEVLAAIDGLQNLSQRIEKAGRQTDYFHVEVRCSPATMALLESDAAPEAWLQARDLWGDLQIVSIRAQSLD